MAVGDGLRPLEQIILQARELDDHGVVCKICSETLCTAEHGDTLEVLLAVAIDHLKHRHGLSMGAPPQ